MYDVEGERILVDLAGGLRVKGGSVSGAEHLHERAPRSSEAGFLCVCAPRDWRGLKEWLRTSASDTLKERGWSRSVTF